MKSNSLEEYIRNNSDNPNPQDGYRVLVVILKEYTIKQILYNPNYSEKIEKEHIASVLHLFLWDKFFYGKQVLLSNETYFKKELLSWFYENKESFYECLNSGDKDISNLIFRLLNHWSFLRDILFEEDVMLLQNCETIDDYNNFLIRHPNTYPEYLLNAEYHIAVLTHTPFASLQRAKKEFGDCEWVQRIECNQTNSGITYMITEDVDDCDKQLLISFLESFSRIHIDNNDEGITKRNDILMSNYVVTEKFWNIVMRHSSLFPVNEERPKLIKYDEANSFIDQLQKMLCVIFRMPTINERAKIGLKGRTEDEIPPHVWEWCQPIVKNTAKVPVVCVMANQNIDDSCLLEYHVPKSCYAACRLVIEV